MDKTVVLVSGNGRLAKQMKKINNIPYQCFYLKRSAVDIKDYDSIVSAICTFKPKYFVHTAAMTFPMDSHDKYPEQSIHNNIIGTANVARACHENKVKLIYISTDYVYRGIGSNHESSAIGPKNKYAISKYGGECAVQMIPDSLIIRVGLINHPFRHEYALSDVTKTMIWDDDFAKVLLNLLDETGIINVGEETNTIYEFVKKRQPEIKPILAKDASFNGPRHLSMETYKFIGLKNKWLKQSQDL